ncbi:MAG: hypothetical protein KDI19_03835 [Pseudomonadales bacterium]|nr:hypothetical protein [Pseudomonadales bacterium]
MTDSDSQSRELMGPLAHRIRDMRTTSRLSDERLNELGIIYPGMDNVEVLNIYRDLRNKLLRLSNYENFVCLVSAIAPDDDTALLSLNLGAVFAFDRSRSSIVIDCDAGHSLLDELTEESDGEGLVDFIEDDADDISLLINESGIDRLRIVPSGSLTETRTETLESARMRQIVLELKVRYPDRYLFINAPSMKLSSEVLVLANVCDMVIFQLSSGLVSQAQVTDAVELIGTTKVAGIVMRES